MTRNNISSEPENISRWQTPLLSGSTIQEEEETQSEEELRQEAYNAAVKKGYDEGFKQGQQKLQQQVMILESFINSLSQPFNELNEQISETLLRLSEKIARSLVRRELRIEPESIMALIRDSVSALNTNTEKVNVQLHPEDALIIREIINASSQELRWVIIEDPLVSRGNCKVSNKDSLIDADIKTRIDLIITQFLGDERNEAKR